MTPIYLDNNATTRVDDRVVQAMLPFFTTTYGNPSSRHHRFGREAEEAVEQARFQISHLIGASPREIVFTSGATESNNLALKGVVNAHRSKGDHVITCATEHHAVLDPLRRMQQSGLRVTCLPVDRFGRVAPEQVRETITDRTILVSIMAANNEVGTLQPIREIGKICKQHGVLFHTDAAQAAGKIPLNVEEQYVDLMSLSAHKQYGPKGVGSLYVRRRSPTVRLEPLMEGGGQERGLRSGTLNVPGIVGFGVACELCEQEMDSEIPRLTALREKLYHGIMELLPGVTLNGHPGERLPGNLNLSFAWVNGEALLMGLRNVVVSSGAACTSANVEPSYVLRALGIDEDLAHASLRFGLGRFNVEEEVDYVIQETNRVVTHLRSISPAYELHQRATLPLG